MKFVIGNRYNWINQPERLIYMGMNRDPSGFWHQFCKADDNTKKVWCEVTESDLSHLEESE